MFAQSAIGTRLSSPPLDGTLLRDAPKRHDQQFRDRIVYWQARGESRACGSSVCMIIDGMDQGKCAVPRHKACQTKLLSGFVRPRLHLTSAIVHGHFVATYLSEADRPKDANTSIEIFAHCLEQLSHRIDLKMTDIHLQADNTCREIKNNHLLRYAGGFVSAGVVRSVRVSCLRTGRSHEDIHQLFGQIAAHLKTLKSGLTSNDFVDSLRNFSRTKMQRPFEKNKLVFKLDQTREWNLDFSFGVSFLYFIFHQVTKTLIFHSLTADPCDAISGPMGCSVEALIQLLWS